MDINQIGPPVVAVFLVFLAILGYWVPAIIAFTRHVPARAQVAVVNLFLGWTVIGWVVALVMAFRDVTPQPAPPPAAG